MDSIGINVHKQSTQICILTKEGEVLEERLRTTREVLKNFFQDRHNTRILGDVDGFVECACSILHLIACAADVMKNLSGPHSLENTQSTGGFSWFRVCR